MTSANGGESGNAATGLLDKVRIFVDSLDAEERQLFATLIGPGVTALYGADDEVSGFAQKSTWDPNSLRGQLGHAMEAMQWRIVEPSGPS